MVWSIEVSSTKDTNSTLPKLHSKMDTHVPKKSEPRDDAVEDQGLGDSSFHSTKICYTRYNAPFWQIVIVSFVAFG